jgi:hypothetical protein
MSDENKKNAVQKALESPVFDERVNKAAEILGVSKDTLATTLVETLGADTPDLLERVSFQDLMENVSGAKPVKVRVALNALRGDGRIGDKADGTTSDLVKELRDESRLCEQGGIEHSAANVRHFRRTGQVPDICVYAGCKRMLASPKAEVSFEDGYTFLAPDGVNPQTGRDEGKFSLEDRAFARILIKDRNLSVDDAWSRLANRSLRTHFSVAAAKIADANPGYANELRKSFSGIRTGSDPFYRERRQGHREY